jgi:hypothetical protein
VANTGRVSPAVGDVRHQACGRHCDGAGHNAAVCAHDVAHLAAHLLAVVVPDLQRTVHSQLSVVYRVTLQPWLTVNAQLMSCAERNEQRMMVGSSIHQALLQLA